MLMLEKNAPVLVVAAHHDDEVLGCGATIARLVGEGHPVTVAVLGEGPVCRDRECREKVREDIRERVQSQAREAAGLLGATFVQAGMFPDNAFDSVALIDVVRAVEAVVDTVRPQAILTHCFGDLNVDHAVVSRAVQTAARPLPGSPVRLVLAFEVASSTEWHVRGGTAAFDPTVFVDVTKQLDEKLNALGLYQGELHPFPHPRSEENVMNMAKVRGAAAGLDAAEAFELVRWRG